MGNIGSGLEPLQPFHDGNTKKRVGFYGENLFKVGPLLDLVGQAIVTLSKRWSEQFEVFVFGVGCESDKSYPPLKELWGILSTRSLGYALIQRWLTLATSSSGFVQPS